MGKKCDSITKRITKKITTARGELTGFVALTTPSTQFNPEGVYTAYILVDKAEGERIYNVVKEIRQEHFKTYGKGSKVADITKVKPYTIVDKETGEETPDPQGRYIIKATRKAKIENGVPTKKVQVVDAKTKPISNCKAAAGTIAREGLILKGYTVAGKTGVSVDLAFVQILKLVEFSGESIDSFDFEEEDGFEATEEVEDTEAVDEEEEF